MKDLQLKYRQAKQKSINFMKQGRLHDYFQTLVEMNNYKLQMRTISAN